MGKANAKISSSLFVGLGVCLLMSPAALAQDIHFSQYTQTPSLVNPALTGASAVLRASVIYKDQWHSVTVPYKTYGASVEMKFNATNWNKAGSKNTFKKAFNRLAGGLSFYSDKAGDGNMGTTQANFSIATFVPVNEASSLSVGLQTSVVQRKIDFSKLIFPEQFNGTGYDPTLVNGETVSLQNFIYPDFSGGINWNYGYNEKSFGGNSELKANVGIAVYHINQPKQKFLTGTKERLNAKYSLHGEALVGIGSSDFTIIPSFLMEFQKPSKEILMGAMVKYYTKNDKKYTSAVKGCSYGIGAYFRTRDAFIITGLFEIEQYSIGYSYDLNISKLSTVSKVRGGPEIFIRYVISNPYMHEKKTSASFL